MEYKFALKHLMKYYKSILLWGIVFIGISGLIVKCFFRGDVSSSLLEKQFHMGTYELLLDYYLYKPPVHDEALPLIVYLHGYMKGKKGIPPEVETLINERVQTNGPSFILAPKCPIPYWWTRTSISLLIKLIEDISAEYSIDKNRVYIMGFSLGSVATWTILSEYPDIFAAGVPISGRGDHSQAESLKNTPIWHFHGEMDSMFPILGSRNLVAKLKILKAPIRFTEFENMGHGILGPSLSHSELFYWLFQQSKSLTGKSQ